MMENKFVRAGFFFLIAFAVPVLLSQLTGGTLDQGIQIGVMMGIIFAVMSQFFEPSDDPVIGES